ncbi:hypothetical protein Pmani_035257 [Petrolisthes manimaculis]|uniref:C-type lectin domain-containing protein n=1 Tax=Petrolisthes manimaculis TaxID=1843537 RepID=A0AAE1NMN9_9EUCA|nr:hypothetical protein Pmani_035257 [Petrolisthes manimaculis]
MMRGLLPVLAVLAVLATPALSLRRSGIRSACDQGWFSIAGNCYKFAQILLTWDDAFDHCEDRGSQLASVHTYAEYKGLLDHMNKNYAGTYWTSGASENGKWLWTATNENMNRAWWGRNPSTADDQCAYFCSYTNKYWNKSCNNKVRFICQKPQNPW